MDGAPDATDLAIAEAGYLDAREAHDRREVARARGLATAETEAAWPAAAARASALLDAVLVEGSNDSDGAALDAMRERLAATERGESDLGFEPPANAVAMARESTSHDASVAAALADPGGFEAHVARASAAYTEAAGRLVVDGLRSPRDWPSWRAWPWSRTRVAGARCSTPSSRYGAPSTGPATPGRRIGH